MKELTSEQLAQLESDGYDDTIHAPVFDGAVLIGFAGTAGFTPPPIRKITTNAWWDRVTEEKESVVRAISDTGLSATPKDYTMSIRLRKIDNSEFIDLDNEKLISAMKELSEGGVFTPEELVSIFSDGTIDEVPEANKSEYLQV